MADARGKLYWITVLTIVSLSLFVASCISRDVPPPSPKGDANAGERSWAEEVKLLQPDVSLIIRTSQNEVQYWVQRNGLRRIIISEVSKAEIRLIGAGQVEFWCRGYVDDGWEGFPYRLIYDVSKDTLVRESLFLPCSSPVHFGYYAGCDTPIGHVLDGIGVTSEGVTVRFHPGDLKPGTLITRVPETEVSWDQQESVLKFAFRGARLSPTMKDPSRAENIVDSGPIRAYSLHEDEQQTEILIKLESPMLYSVTHSGDDKIVMTILFRVP